MDFDIITPCAVCAVQARIKRSTFFAARGLEWPTREVAGHQVHLACASDAEFAERSATDGTLVIEGGIGRWTTNGSVIPEDCAALMVALGLAPGLDLTATRAARDTETREFLAAYRANPPQITEEQLAEMRAAFGPGEKVVNIITGQETQL